MRKLPRGMVPALAAVMVGLGVAPIASASGAVAPAAATGNHVVPYIGQHKVRDGNLTGSIAIDRGGGIHEIGTFNDDQTDYDGPSPLYVTKTHHANHFSYRLLKATGTVKGISPRGDFVTTNLKGTKVDLVAEWCTGVASVQLPDYATKPPTVRAKDFVINADECPAGGPGNDDNDAALVAAQALPHGRMILLFWKSPTNEKDGTATTYVGRPGSTFRQLPLPDAITQNNIAMSRDASNGKIYVAGVVGTAIDLWTLDGPTGTWQGPQQIAKFTVDAPQTVTSVAASHGLLWVATQTPFPTPAISILHRDISETWSTLTPLPGSKKDEYNVKLAANPGPKVSVWAVDAVQNYPPKHPKKYGVYARHATGSGWSKPKQLVSAAQPQGLSVAPNFSGGIAYAFNSYVDPGVTVDAR